MSRRRVLYVIPSMTSGGAERVFLHLLNNMDRGRFEPMLAIGVHRGEFLESIREDVEIFELNAERARKAIPGLVKIVRKLNPGVVASTVGMNFAAALGKPFFPARTRVILREGSSPTAFLNDVERQSPIRAKFYRQCYKYVYKLADAVICQSEFMREDVERNMKVPAANLRRIYNPVDLAQIDKMALETPKAPISKDGIKFITVGRLAFEKAYDNLLRAFVTIRDANPDASLTFIGKGDDEAALRALTHDLGLNECVRFLGYQSNPYSYLKRSDIFVLPSRYEGFSNAIVEALACGLPVVATDCPSANREVITEGLNGWFAENDSIESLAKTLNQAIRERRNLTAETVRESCESRFALDKILPQYEELFSA